MRGCGRIETVQTKPALDTQGFALARERLDLVTVAPQPRFVNRHSRSKQSFIEPQVNFCSLQVNIFLHKGHFLIHDDLQQYSLATDLCSTGEPRQMLQLRLPVHMRISAEPTRPIPARGRC